MPLSLHRKTVPPQAELLHRRIRCDSQAGTPIDEHAGMFDWNAGNSGQLTCQICGQQLLGDPEDQPFPPLGPMCGECYRAQQMDDEVEWSAEFGSGADLLDRSRMLIPTRATYPRSRNRSGASTAPSSPHIRRRRLRSASGT